MPVTYQLCEICKKIFKAFDQGNVCLPGDIGGAVIRKKVTDGDIGGEESKISHSCGDVIFEWSII